MFGKNKRINSLKGVIAELEGNLTYKTGQVDRLRTEIDQLTTRAIAAQAETVKLKKLVRDQSGADLLVNALKAMGAIPDPKPVDYNDEARRLMSNRYLAAQQQAAPLPMMHRGEAVVVPPPSGFGSFTSHNMLHKGNE